MATPHALKQWSTWIGRTDKLSIGWSWIFHAFLPSFGSRYLTDKTALPSDVIIASAEARPLSFSLFLDPVALQRLVDVVCRSGSQVHRHSLDDGRRVGSMHVGGGRTSEVERQRRMLPLLAVRVS